MRILKEDGLPFSRFNDGNYGGQLAADVISTHQVNQTIIDPISTKFIGERHLYLHTGMVLSNVKGQTLRVLIKCNSKVTNEVIPHELILSVLFHPSSDDIAFEQFKQVTNTL